MICLATQRETGLENLTEDQLADIDRLLMMLWKTRSLARPIRPDVYTDTQCTDKHEVFHNIQFLCTCDL